MDGNNASVKASESAVRNGSTLNGTTSQDSSGIVVMFSYYREVLQSSEEVEDKNPIPFGIF